MACAGPGTRPCPPQQHSQHKHVEEQPQLPPQPGRAQQCPTPVQPQRASITAAVQSPPGKPEPRALCPRALWTRGNQSPLLSAPGLPEHGETRAPALCPRALWTHRPRGQTDKHNSLWTLVIYTETSQTLSHIPKWRARLKRFKFVNKLAKQSLLFTKLADMCVELLRPSKEPQKQGGCTGCHYKQPQQGRRNSLCEWPRCTVGISLIWTAVTQTVSISLQIYRTISVDLLRITGAWSFM